MNIKNSDHVNNYFKVAGATPEYLVNTSGYLVHGESRTFTFCDRSLKSIRTAYLAAVAYAAHGVERHVSIYKMSGHIPSGPWNQAIGVGYPRPVRDSLNDAQYSAQCARHAIQVWRGLVRPSKAWIPGVSTGDDS